MSKTRSGWAIAILIALLAAAQIYAFHWGVVTPDTVEQYGQALINRYEDWHPPITAWLWHLLLGFHAGSASILLFDVILYWLGIGLIAMAAQRRYGSAWGLLVVSVGALPIPFGQMGSLLKDPLLTALCLLASGLIVSGRRRGWFAIPLLIVASATRFNAIFATLPLLIGLLPDAVTASRKRLVASITAGMLLLAGSGWLINVAMLEPRSTQPIFSLVNFDLAGIAAQGTGNPYPSMTAAEAHALTHACYGVRLYNPANSDRCNAVEDRLAGFARIHRQSAVSIWLRAVRTEPLAYLRHRIKHLNWNWRLFVPYVPDDAVYMMSEPNALGLAFAPNPLTRFVVSGARALAWSPLGRPATWLAVAAGLLILSGTLASRRVIRMLTLSALGYGGAYAIVSVAPDLRYNLWTMVAAMIATVFALADISAGARPSRPRTMAALGIVLIVIIVEMAGLMIGAEV